MVHTSSRAVSSQISTKHGHERKGMSSIPTSTPVNLSLEKVIKILFYEKRRNGAKMKWNKYLVVKNISICK
jgi:hypothetical protein